MWAIILMGTAFACLVWYWVTVDRANRAERRQAFIGDGYHETDVVGESFYQSNLMSIAGPKTKDGYNLECKALLVPNPDNPHDPNAIKVMINGKQVGHLSREMAADYAKFLQQQGNPRLELVVGALITGGWKRRYPNGKWSEGHYGVRLDIENQLLPDD